MANIGLRLGIGGVAACIGLGIKFMHRSSAGDEYRKVAHKIVAHVDGYSAKPDYYDWLVDEAHDHVFNDAYNMDYSRYRDRSWVDGDKYVEDLFSWMIDAANNDNAKGVADSLAKYRNDHVRGGGK
jgi:hypothetical protein